MASERNRDEVTEQVIQLFVDIIGCVERHEVTEQTDFVHDFKIIDDDLSCFVMQVQWQFRLHASQEDWDVITTIRQVVDLIMRDSP
ncbi:acyl carrier protein [Pseudomonas asplenii]|uniref:acyl carrier protein n=1 Tax=Pseudomonas asplenii TaxID=53407 RepID=UPI0003A967EB|nr:acyl carrier protein [Pseudomonas fuscovaginae]